MKVIIYFKSINSIGGVESFLYSLSQKYDFEFYYKEGDSDQIKRLAKNIKVRKYKGQKLKCDKFIVNYNPDIIDNVEAKEYIMMVHCDYSGVNFAPITHPKFTKYIGVSQYVCDVFTRLTGIPCELCYNPMYLKKSNIKKKKGLHIIYAGRLTSEKQGWLIDKFVEKMDKSGIEYDLTIYTNRKPRFMSKNVILKQPKLDITKEIEEASFMLITSKHEAYCLSAIESLVLGTPLICTDLPVFRELGIDKTNSIKIDETLRTFNPEDLLKEFDFNYTAPKDNWGKYLPKEKNYNPDELLEVRVLKKKLWLVAEDRHLKQNDRCLLTQVRACELEAKGFVEIEDSSIKL